VLGPFHIRMDNPSARGKSPWLTRYGSKAEEMRNQPPSRQQRLLEQQSAHYINESEWPFTMPLASPVAGADPSQSALWLDGEPTGTVGLSRGNHGMTSETGEGHSDPARAYESFDTLADRVQPRCLSACGTAKDTPRVPWGQGTMTR
jgi:hypothetical protein